MPPIAHRLALSPHTYSLAAVLVAPLAEALEARGIDSKALFERAEIDPRCAFEPDGRIPSVKIDRLWNLAIEATGDEALPLEQARRVHPGSLHALSFALYSSATLRDMTERLARYFDVLTDGAAAVCETIGEEFHLILEPAYPGIAPGRRIAFFAIVLRLWTSLSRADLRPLRLSLQGVPQPQSEDALQRLRAYFGCAITFAADESRMVLALDEALRPLPAGNPELARRGEEVVRDYLAAMDRASASTTRRVAALIVSQLSSDAFGKGAIAARLGLSTSTLQRRLSAEGVSFSQLLDATRRELAVRYLRDGRRPIKEVAYLLGFTDLSNFTRAFRAWFGASPKAFQESLRQVQ